MNTAVMRAAAVLVSLGWCDADVDALDGGYSNETFRVARGTAEAVLRLNGHQNDALGLSRSAEVEALRAAAALGIAPGVIAAADDFLMTTFVPGDLLTPTLARSTHYIAELGTTLAKVHQIDAVVGRSCDPFWLVRTYLDGARRLGVPMPDGLDEVLEQVDAIEQRAAARDDPPVFCHNDFYEFNLIATGDGRLIVIDWELSGLGNRYFDLATPSFHMAFSPQQDRMLLEAYCGTATDEQVAALHDMKYLNMVREVAWGLLHAGLDAAAPEAVHANHCLDYTATAMWFYDRLRAGHVTA